MTEQQGISLNGARVEISGRVILDGITFAASDRRIGVIGRNGSGKSTLSRLLAGLIAPNAGKVSLNGIDPASDRKAALGEVGIIFQNPDHQIIFPTVLEELAFGLTQLGQDKADASDNALKTLETFGKSHWQETSVATLSQGQKHLLCLMAISAMSPNILILDEPFAGLDIPTRLQLQRHLNHYDGTLVHISHNPADLTDYDVVLWLDRGKIVEIGAAAGVLARFETEMIKLGGSDDISDLTR